MSLRTVAAFGLAATILLTVAPAHAVDHDALWKIVSQQCVPDETDNHKPDPCIAVDLAGGYAVLKDSKGPHQYLVIPIAKVPGIEDPALLEADTPNYFAAAWGARHYTEALLGKPLPRDDFALAVNSPEGRSQNQLHIHVDCLRPEVRDALRSHVADITTDWKPLPVTLEGHTYRARRVDGETLDSVNPFLMLADGIEGARDDMQDQTLAAAGITFPDGRPGFVLLDDQASLADGDHASSAELLDHACAVAQEGGR